MEKRRTLLKQQSEINDVSDLLTLNFIFDEAWIKRNLSAEAARHLLSVSLPEVPNEERLLLLECSEFAASHTFQETNDFVLKKIGGKGKTITGEVLRGFTERASPWLRSNSYPTPLSTLPQNEDTYTYATMENIVHGTLHDFEVLDHWGRDFLPVPVGWEERYEPDYYAEYFGFPFVLVEIKKPAASDEELEGDSRKLPCMGKLMVDRMGRAGVQDPKVIVFLVQESRCEISVISLDYEATYVKKPVGAFELPRTNLQLPLLIPGQRLLHFVRGPKVTSTEAEPDDVQAQSDPDPTKDPESHDNNGKASTRSEKPVQEPEYTDPAANLEQFVALSQDVKWIMENKGSRI
ncbi:hypothetical protein BGX31_002865 [Mortierella sp. GBA43]|nr:hypothetical protein BGX31_002865 [Mortierella sp. GBA43]